MGVLKQEATLSYVENVSDDLSCGTCSKHTTGDVIGPSSFPPIGFFHMSSGPVLCRRDEPDSCRRVQIKVSRQCMPDKCFLLFDLLLNL